MKKVMKAEMVALLLEHRELLQNVKLVATGTTGKHVERAGFQVKKLLSGPKGGDAQIAALAAEKNLDMVIFFRDSLDKHPHEPMCKCLCAYVTCILFL